MALVPAPHEALAGVSGQDAPDGSAWYRAINAGSAGYAPTFEWYVRAQHLRSNWVYRIELVVDSTVTYSIGSARTDANGTLANHGTLTRLADHYCVGMPAVPQPYAAKLVLGIKVKSDGSGSGPVTASGPYIGHGQTLPCGGNGDSNFDYWLVSRQMFTAGSNPPQQ